jgi:hypothetical protein
MSYVLEGQESWQLKNGNYSFVLEYYSIYGLVFNVILDFF